MRPLALATIAFLIGCGGEDLVLPSEGEPAEIVIVQGDNQNGRVGEVLAQPVVVEVTDGTGRPVAGARVVYELEGADPRPDTATTDGSGLASAEIVLGPDVGPATGEIRVVAPESPVEVQTSFSATALPANANGLSIVSGDGQSGPAGTVLPEPLVVEVTDAFGNPIAGVEVAWTVEGGGSVSASSSTTDASGRASVTRTLGSAAGTERTLASSTGLAGSPATFTHTVQAGSASGVLIVSGDGQSAQPGAVLPEALVVRVVDGDGNAVSDAAVTWVVTAGGGSVNPESGTTDAQGQASTTWTLGSAPGVNTVEAIVSGVGEATFNATALSGSPARIRIVSGDDQTGQAGARLNGALVVEVLDEDDRALPGVAVQWSVASGGGSVDPATATTDGSGRASTSWTLGSTVGAQRVNASATGAGTVSFDAVATPGAPSVLALTTQPSADVTEGEPFGRQPVVQLRDGSGNNVARAGVAVTAAVATGPGRITGTTTRTTGDDGRAVFTDLAIADGTGAHTLIFAAGGFTSVISDPVEVSAANTAPTGTDDSYSTAEDVQLTVPAPGVLANDSDAENDPLTAELETGPAHGQLTLRSDGSFDYTPEPDYFGDDSFTYRVSDGSLESAPITVLISVTPVNDSPSYQAGPDQQVGVSAGPQSVAGWASAIQAGPGESGQTLTFEVTLRSGAEIFLVAPAISSDGTLTYTPGSEGSAEAGVVLRDSGGTSAGGVDASAPHTLTFAFGP